MIPSVSTSNGNLSFESDEEGAACILGAIGREMYGEFRGILDFGLHIPANQSQLHWIMWREQELEEICGQFAEQIRHVTNGPDPNRKK